MKLDSSHKQGFRLEHTKLSPNNSRWQENGFFKPIQTRNSNRSYKERRHDIQRRGVLKGKEIWKRSNKMEGSYRWCGWEGTNEKPLFVSVLALGRLLIPSLYLSMPLLYIYIYVYPSLQNALVGWWVETGKEMCSAERNKKPVPRVAQSKHSHYPQILLLAC